jgi:hypothetical protein
VGLTNWLKELCEGVCVVIFSVCGWKESVYLMVLLGVLYLVSRAVH